MTARRNAARGTAGGGAPGAVLGAVAADPGALVAGTAERVIANVGRVLQGKDDVVELALIGLLADGHVLLEDVPGVGKTTMAKALATSMAGDYGRVQFTPDLLPGDVLGVTVWDRSSDRFRFRPGPVFTNVLVADEINRCPPRTQSALLEAMAERHVTIDGTSHALPSPFLVVATQNPEDSAGTYPLPDSQLDRFLLRLSLGYPEAQAERDMVRAQTRDDPMGALESVVGLGDVQAAQRAVRDVHVSDAVVDYLVRLAHATRRSARLSLAMSPRATLALHRASQARAAVDGRSFVLPDDVQAMAGPVLSHRLALSGDTRVAGLTADDVVAEVLDAVPVPVPLPVRTG